MWVLVLEGGRFDVLHNNGGRGGVGEEGRSWVMAVHKGVMGRRRLCGGRVMAGTRRCNMYCRLSPLCGPTSSVLRWDVPERVRLCDVPCCVGLTRLAGLPPFRTAPKSI